MNLNNILYDFACPACKVRYTCQVEGDLKTIKTITCSDCERPHSVVRLLADGDLCISEAYEPEDEAA